MPLTPLEQDPQIHALLTAEGFSQVTGVQELTAAEVEQRLHSPAGYRYLLTSIFYPYPRWLTLEELPARWTREIQPQMVNRSWEGWYDAYEWETDRPERIIVFIHGYAPI